MYSKLLNLSISAPEGAIAGGTVTALVTEHPTTQIVAVIIQILSFVLVLLRSRKEKI